jgi:hypothetical protein
LETCGVFYAGKHAGKSWQQNGKPRLFVRYPKFFVTPHNPAREEEHDPQIAAHPARSGHAKKPVGSFEVVASCGERTEPADHRKQRN